MTLPFGSHLGRQQNLNIAELVGSDLPAFSPKRLREKRWCYMGIISEECISGTALVHLGYAANAFSFVFDRKAGKMLEKGYVISPWSGLHFDRNPDTSDCLLESKDDSIKMLHRVNEGKRLLSLDIAKGKNRQIVGNIEIQENPQSQPLQLFTPMSLDSEKTNTVFTQKIAGLSAQGYIETKDKRFEFTEANSFAIFDWTNGFHNRITEWNWASAGGTSQCGKTIGINFSRNVYSYGFGENVLWIDGEAILLGDIDFTYQQQAPMQPWTISNQEKSVELIFTPEGKREAKESFVIAASHFIQACGSFSGYISDKSGKRIQLNDVGGVVEEHYAKW